MGDGEVAVDESSVLVATETGFLQREFLCDHTPQFGRNAAPDGLQSPTAVSVARNLNVTALKEGRMCFYLTTHSTHFIYGYMASDIW